MRGESSNARSVRWLTALSTVAMTLAGGVAQAATIFSDEFTSDPGSLGWVEQIRGTGPGSSAITSDGSSAVFTHGGAGSPVLAFTIDRVVDTTGYQDIQVKLWAHQSNTGWENGDFLMIQYDANGSGWGTSPNYLGVLLQDVQVWDGVHQPPPGGTTSGITGNTVSTPTGLLSLPTTANDNAAFKIRIEGKMNANAETYFLDRIEVTGTAVPEPASLAMVGLGGLATMRRRRHR